MFSGALSLGVVRAELSPASSTVYTTTITVFDHEYCHWPDPGVSTFKIPWYWQVTGCLLEYDAHCDPDDWYLRAMAFWMDGYPNYYDGRGGGIGCYRTGPHDIRGWTIYPGQTLSRTFDMSNVMFPRDWPQTGGDYYTFIPGGAGYMPGYFSPGVHEVTGFVSSQYPGAVQESWISIKLHFQYILVPMPATIDFDPDTLNLKSEGKYVTVYIELPDCDIGVNDIVITTVELNGIPALETPTPEIGDHDGDTIPDLMVKFDREAVQNLLMPGDPVIITISGSCGDGILFEGTETTRVIH